LPGPSRASAISRGSPSRFIGIASATRRVSSGVRTASTRSVAVVPGANAALAALVLSGFPTDRFVFEGFLPVKPGRRRQRLEELREEERTAILYEAPHRLLKTLAEIQDVFGDIRLAVSRELTKAFEETLRDRASRLRERFTTRRPRGEYALVLPPKRLRYDA